MINRLTSFVRKFNRLTYGNSTLNLQLACFLLLTFSALGCGGGTSGTGGTGSLFKGQIKNEVGKPVAAARVTLGETGDSGRSNRSGYFVVKSRISSRTVTLFVDNKGQEANTVIEDLPDTEVNVDLDLELNSKERTLTVRHKTVARKAVKKKKRKVRKPRQVEESLDETEDDNEEVTEDAEDVEEVETPEPEETPTIQPAPSPTVGPTPVQTSAPIATMTPVSTVTIAATNTPLGTLK